MPSLLVLCRCVLGLARQAQACTMSWHSAARQVAMMQHLLAGPSAAAAAVHLLSLLLPRLRLLQLLLVMSRVSGRPCWKATSEWLTLVVLQLHKEGQEGIAWHLHRAITRPWNLQLLLQLAYPLNHTHAWSRV